MTVTEDEAKALWAKYNESLRKLRNGKVGACNGLERDYGKTYQNLVSAGLAMPLKKKYRVMQ